MENTGKWSVCRLWGWGAAEPAGWSGPCGSMNPAEPGLSSGGHGQGQQASAPLVRFPLGPLQGSALPASPRGSPRPMGTEWGCGLGGAGPATGSPASQPLRTAPPYREVRSRGPVHACRVAVTHPHRHPALHTVHDTWLLPKRCRAGLPVFPVHPPEQTSHR